MSDLKATLNDKVISRLRYDEAFARDLAHHIEHAETR
jgi:hypothetical protein